MKAIITCLLFVLHLSFTQAQNLVPDSSFENNKFVPMDFSALNASRSWSIPSRGTSDLFCKCDRKTKLLREKIYSEVDVPQNPMGYQDPHSGICYAGLFAFSHGDYREYLQTPLTEPLQKNRTYLFTAYISLADYSCTSIDQLGLCFLTRKADYPSSDVITDLDPVYISIENEVGRDTDDWHEISVSYTSQGGECYLLLGSFGINKIRKTKLKAPGNIKPRINQNAGRDAYYFIDDVSLVEIHPEEQTDAPENSEQETADEIMPDTLLTLEHVLFQSNEMVLLPASYPELDLLAAYLIRKQDLQIDILGHTDNSGTEANNKTLSAGRAKAVADYLASHGIDRERINYKGYGSQKPVAANDTEEGRQQNRRVEFRLTEK